jgi:hypothetical protein
MMRRFLIGEVPLFPQGKSAARDKILGLVFLEFVKKLPRRNPTVGRSKVQFFPGNCKISA